MKKPLIVVGVILTLLVLLWGLSPPRGDIVSGRATGAASRVKQLLVASYAFYLDESKKTSADGEYPKRFAELVPGYLSEKDLEKLTANIQIDYFPPDGPPSEGQVILVAHISGFVIYGLAPFDVRWYELK